MSDFENLIYIDDLITQKEVINMAYTLACKDTGIQCSYVSRGETMDELMADAGKHGKNVHDYTDEQLNDPEMMKKIKAVIKQE